MIEPYLIITFLAFNSSNFFPPKISETVDIESLKSVVEKREIIFVGKCGKENLLATSVGIINASPEEVYSVITDWNNLPKFLPGLKNAKIVGKPKDNVFFVEFSISVKFSVFGTSVKYITEEHTEERPARLWSLVVDGPTKGGFRQWELVNLQDKTLAFFSVCENLKPLPIVGIFFKDNPQMEIGIPVSSTMIILRSIKDRIERLRKN